MGKFGDLLMQQAGGAVGNAAQSLVGGATGMLFAGYNDRRQIKQQTKLQNLQIQGEKQMTDYNYQKQLDMWNATGYGAQMKQLQGAGLNPALIYGTGGSGGMTTDIKPGNVSGTEAPKGGGEVMGMAIANMQMQLMNAQRKNIDADTANKQADTTYKSGAQTALAGAQTGAAAAQTASLTQGIQNQKAQQTLTQVETTLKQLETQFQNDTMQNRESLINISLSKLIEETRIFENDREISDATKIDKMKIIATTVKGMALDNLNKQKALAKTDKDMQLIDEQIKQIQQGLDINSIDQEMAKDGMNPKSGNIMKIIHNVLRGIAQWFGH